MWSLILRFLVLCQLNACFSGTLQFFGEMFMVCWWFSKTVANKKHCSLFHHFSFYMNVTLCLGDSSWAENVEKFTRYIGESNQHGLLDRFSQCSPEKMFPGSNEQIGCILRYLNGTIKSVNVEICIATTISSLKSWF